MSNKCSNYFFSDLFVRNMHLDVAHAHATAIRGESPTARDSWPRNDSIVLGTRARLSWLPGPGTRSAVSCSCYPVRGSWSRYCSRCSRFIVPVLSVCGPRSAVRGTF